LDRFVPDTVPDMLFPKLNTSPLRLGLARVREMTSNPNIAARDRALLAVGVLGLDDAAPVWKENRPNE
jgi:hypothetical protein